MATINGSLASVNSVPTEGTVLLRALTLRPGSTFAVTGEPKVAVIKTGAFTIENVEPGPVQLTIQGNGVTHDVRVDVPERDEVDFLDLLDNVYEWEPEQVSAVKLAAREARKAADEAGRIASAFRGAEQLEGWAESASSSADAADKSARAAASSASAAKSSAGAAKADAGKAATSATGAGKSADAAGESATAAAGSADEAGAAAERADSSAATAAAAVGEVQQAGLAAIGEMIDLAGEAEQSATEASSSAKAAKADADRAEGVVDSVRWDDDKLIVAGKTSPSLRGEKGDKGEPGQSGASTWDKIEGKPNEFSPSAHKHTLADITNAPNSHTSAATASTLVSRDSGGRAQFATPTSAGHAATKGYVDGAVRGKADKSYVDTALQSVAKGDFELRVASSAPASGTASNVITFVKE